MSARGSLERKKKENKKTVAIDVSMKMIIAGYQNTRKVSRIVESNLLAHYRSVRVSSGIVMLSRASVAL